MYVRCDIGLIEVPDMYDVGSGSLVYLTQDAWFGDCEKV